MFSQKTLKTSLKYIKKAGVPKEYRLRNSNCEAPFQHQKVPKMQAPDRFGKVCPAM